VTPQLSLESLAPAWQEATSSDTSASAAGRAAEPWDRWPQQCWWLDKLPPVPALPLRFQKRCAPQTRLKQHRQSLQPHCLTSLETLVPVTACSATSALTEPAKQTLPEVTARNSTNTVDLSGVQHHELKENQAGEVHSIPTSGGLANQIRSGHSCKLRQCSPALTRNHRTFAAEAVGGMGTCL